MKTLVLTLSLILGLAACAAPDVDRPTVDDQLLEMGLIRSEEEARIPTYRINGWNHLDDKHLIVNAGVKDRYLVELLGSCPDLDFAVSIGFTTTGVNRLDQFGNILVRRSGGGREYCPIQNIQKLMPIG